MSAITSPQSTLALLQQKAQKYSDDNKTKVAAGFWQGDTFIWGVNKRECYIPPADVAARSQLFYNLMTHAEVDLCRQIDKGTLVGKVLYTTLFPCDACVKVLLEFGLDTKVVALQDRPEMHWCQRSKKLLEAHHIDWEIYG